MPIYVYACEACKSEPQEILMRASDPAPECEQCKGALTKQVTAAGFSFKGSGFYCTDYGKSTCNPKSEK